MVNICIEHAPKPNRLVGLLSAQIEGINSMRKIILAAGILPALMAGTVAAQAEQRPAGILYPQVKEMRTTTVTGEGFNANLAREYQDLSAFETDEMYDWCDGEKYAGKANAAARGEAVAPYVPTEWNIGEEDKMAELVSARARLVAALDAGGRERKPAVAARAQAMYDCWVEQQEEGHQPDHIAACRGDFEAAYAELTGMGVEIARETVYFAFDSAAISDQEQSEINDFVAKMAPMNNIVLYVEGHTDTSGSSAYNQRLSERRADAVRKELVSQGMNVAHVKKQDVKAVGESQPAVATGDGVKEARNRRVEIIARGAVHK